MNHALSSNCLGCYRFCALVFNVHQHKVFVFLMLVSHLEASNSEDLDEQAVVSCAAGTFLT